MTFREIKFGLSEAEEEKATSPQLLLDGFFDGFGYTEQLLKKNTFLIYGSKGSGKSALGSRLELLSKEDDRLFVQQHYLVDFPYKRFSELFPGSEAPESRYPTHWEFVLLIALLNSFKKDRNCDYENPSEYFQVIEILDKLGAIPDKDFKEIIKTTTKSQINLKIYKYEQSSEKSDLKISIIDIFDLIKNVCYKVTTPSLHLIIIDGLDIVLSQRQKQYQALSALITASNRINKILRNASINGKIIVLCRTDLLDKLKDPNLNKPIQDSGLLLNWYQDQKDIFSTNLANLINLRIKISLKEPLAISEYLPYEIEGKPSLKFLLEHTRHTPRDLIQLL